MPYECRDCAWVEEREPETELDGRERCHRCLSKRVTGLTMKKLLAIPGVNYCRACDRVHGERMARFVP